MADSYNIEINKISRNPNRPDTWSYIIYEAPHMRRLDARDGHNSKEDACHRAADALRRFS